MQRNKTESVKIKIVLNDMEKLKIEEINSNANSFAKSNKVDRLVWSLI